MLRAVSLLALLALTAPVRADDKKVTVRFLGGAEKAPLDGLKVSIRSYTGDWSEDKRRVASPSPPTAGDSPGSRSIKPG